MTEDAGVPGMVPVDRVELVTQDVDLLAELIEQMCGDHSATFLSADPARIDGGLRLAAAGALSVGLPRYGGFTYTARSEPTPEPTVMWVRSGSAALSWPGEDLCLVPGDVVMGPPDAPFDVLLDGNDLVTLRVPRSVLESLAAEHHGLRPGTVRFTAMTPVSAAAQQTLSQTMAHVCGQLVTSGTAGIHPLVLPELTRLAAAAFLETFPSTIMTAGYVPGPGWVPPAAVHRAVTFITEHAGEPVTAGEIVTAVAYRWGFSGSSRFAADYRRAYGITPSQTLRNN